MNEPLIPLVRLEIEGMRQSMIMALTQHTDEINKQVTLAVNDFCTEENLNRIIRAKTTGVIKGIVEQEVERYFNYGAGNRFIRDLVVAKLDADVAAREAS